MKRILALICAVIMLFSMTACKDDAGSGVNIDSKLLKIDFNSYEESEDIPSWDGKKVTLSVWVDTSSGSTYGSRKMTTENDVVTPEWERITGVHMDDQNSYDNAGGTFEERIAKIIATGDYPSAATRLPNMNDLVENDLLWRLDEYIKEYAPTVYKYWGPDSEYGGIYWREQMETLGGVYQISLGSNVEMTRKFAEEFDGYKDLTVEQLNSRCGVGTSAHAFINVRDDILKEIYPEAHTAKELKAIYEKNGKFTKEEILDVPLDDFDDVIEFLYKVRDVIKAKGLKDTYATATHNGGDNWMILTNWGDVYGYGPRPSYFSHYDLEDQEVKFTFKEPWFKEMLKVYNKLIRDGVASEEALIDTNSIYKEKVNSGKYIVTKLNNDVPADNSPNNAYCYRKVFLRGTVNDEKFLQGRVIAESNNGWSFFKKGISEEDLIIAIRSLEFAMSFPGQKLSYWGPKSAGLYTEDENGYLHYKDQYNVDRYIYGNETDEYIDNGFGSGPWPGRPVSYVNIYDPKFFENTLTTWEAAFDMAIYEKLPDRLTQVPTLYDGKYTAAIPELDEFWKARDAFETNLIKCFAAKTDAEFEKAYDAAIKGAEKKGLTDETLKKFDAEFRKNNAAYMDNLK